jgi:AhpC/TSA antioxidant enzyme
MFDVQKLLAMFGLRSVTNSIAYMNLATRSAAVAFGTMLSVVGSLLLFRTIGTNAIATSNVASSISDSIHHSLPKLYDTTLIPIRDYGTDPITGSVTVKVDDSTTLRNAAQSSGTPDIPSICFVVRRPGCVLCREHALQLVQMYTEKSVVPFHLWGIVKETGVDDIGLMEFHSTYFQMLPLYHDPQNAIYEAFGRRSILKLRTWNPISIYRGFVDIGRRLSAQNITGNYKGEGIIQGGILIFDSKGTLRYSINKEIGQPFDMNFIYKSLRDVSLANGDAGSQIGSLQEASTTSSRMTPEL